MQVEGTLNAHPAVKLAVATVYEDRGTWMGTYLQSPLDLPSAHCMLPPLVPPLLRLCRDWVVWRGDWILGGMGFTARDQVATVKLFLIDFMTTKPQTLHRGVWVLGHLGLGREVCASSVHKPQGQALQFCTLFAAWFSYYWMWGREGNMETTISSRDYDIFLCFGIRAQGREWTNSTEAV